MALQVTAGVVLVLVAYVMGSIPFAIVIGKWFWHVDVRDHGSGNVGTTNVFRVLGRRAGTLVLIGDMAKGFIPVYIAVHYFPTWFALIVALAALLGHMYSVFLRGGGGKGVATGAGIVLALVPWIFIIALGIFLVLLLTTRMVSLASMAAALTFAVCTIAFDKPIWYQILAVFAALVVIFAHRSNIRRIALRCENKVTFPWDHDRGSSGSGQAGDGRARLAVAPCAPRSSARGAGARAFARLLWRNGHEVQVLTLTAAEAAELNETHVNPHFLPGVELSPEIRFVGMAEASLDGAELVVYAVPTQVVREVSGWVAQRRPGAALQLSLAKGLELHTLLRPTEVIAKETGRRGRGAVRPQPCRGDLARHAGGHRDRGRRRRAWRAGCNGSSPATRCASTPTTTSSASSSAAPPRTPSPSPSASPTASVSATTRERRS